MSVSAKFGSGKGPGAITPDGCSVDLYLLLPPGHRETAIIASVTPPGGSVLELGAGTGRVTHCLIDQGLSVVAVDESREMLDHINGAVTVQSAIEDLQLSQVFDVVVLGSRLINLPDDDAALALLRTCERHVAPDGHVLVERLEPEWFDSVEETTVEREGIVYSLTDIQRPSPGELTATMTYSVGQQGWSQTFTTRCIGDERLADLLAAAGLTLARFLDPDKTWIDAAVGKRPK